MVATLDQFKRGMKGRILHIADMPPCDEPECRCCLRRLGLREGLTVEVVNDYDPVMIRFDGCCLALRRHLLRTITAEDGLAG